MDGRAFYLPRIFVYHVERASTGSDVDQVFQVMELKLLRVIMNPAMIVTWVCGLLMVFTPGIVDWSAYWPWLKVSVIGMTWFHHWLGLRRKDFEASQNTLTGRQYRMMNEVPTILMLIIVVSVVVNSDRIDVLASIGVYDNGLLVRVGFFLLKF